MSEFESLKDKGFCEHGNFPQKCPKCNGKDILGIRREDLSGATQQEREKKNIRYKKNDQEMIAKYVNKKGENIARLDREKRILDRLSDTGMVPKVIDYKQYNGGRSRLLLEQVPGVSLDHMPRKQRLEFMKRHTEDVVHESAVGLQKIREKGVFVVDVNEGTFLFNESDDEKLETHLVDFELGYDMASGTADELNDSFSFLQKNDIGFALAQEEGNPVTHDTDVLAQCEMYRWAKTMERLIVDRYADVQIPEEQLVEYKKYRERLKPVVEKTLRERAKKYFEKIKMKTSPSANEQKYVEMGEESYIDWSLKFGFEPAISQQCVKFTFPQLCKANGVTLSEKSMNFIARCLSIDIAERPSSFEELLDE